MLRRARPAQFQGQPRAIAGRHRLASLLGLAALTTLLLAPLAGRVAAATEVVHISGSGLAPQSLTVAPGTVVTWINDDGQRHRVRSRSGPAEFDSGDLAAGVRSRSRSGRVGTYQYRDDRNPNLAIYFGTVVVASGPAPSPGSSVAPGGSAPPPGPPTANQVHLAGRAFTPATLTISLGSTVTWINDDGRDHTVSARDQSFDSGVVNAGGTYVRTFTTPGTFAYLCLIHPDMTGTIAVQSAAGGTPPPAPSPTPAPSIPPPSPGSVSIIDFDFQPTSTSITAGTSVTFVNRGAALHTVTARDGSFDSGFVPAGGTYQRTFATPGTYAYFCSIHPNMLGTILVSGPDGASPPPASPTPAPTPPPAAPPGAITIADFAFRPGSVTVQPGTTVTWANTGAAPHTVTSRAGLFDSGIVKSGGQYTHTFANPGTYQYFCAIHPDMSGTVLVPDAGGALPPPAAAPAPPPAAVAGDIRIADFSFTPASLSVPVGTTVHWVNGGVAPHTVTARAGAFDSGFLSTGDAFSRKFTASGTIEYFCTLHPTMTGTVIVTDANGQAPPPAPASPPGASPPPGEVGVIDIALLDFRIDPPTATIAAGASIRFVNEGAALHTATQPGSWDTGFLTPGQAATVAFNTPGTYAYLCVIHPAMTASLVVTAAAGAGPGVGAPSPVPGAPSPPPGGPSPGTGVIGPAPGGGAGGAAPPAVPPLEGGAGEGPAGPLIAAFLIVVGVVSFGWMIRGAVTVPS